MPGEPSQPEEARAAPAPKRKRRKLLYVGAALFAVCVAALLVHRFRSPGPLKITYSGDSSGLRQTVIVPTLDTPIPKGKNVIWCSSFQVAWNQLKDDVVKAPVKLKNAEAAAERLNLAKQSEADLPPGEFYATAGWVKDGIVQTIQQEMAKRFPSVPKPTFDDPGAVLIAYAYLAANVKFTMPFFENRKPLLFSDSAGGKTR